MKSDIWIGKKGFRYWYYRMRDSQYFAIALVGLALITCLVLIFAVIIPQINTWFSIREEVLATRARISTLQNNITFIETLNKAELTTQLRVASRALPPEKDFGAMLDVLSNAAVSSGVSLNDYAFQVGNVASLSAGQRGELGTNGVSSVKISLVVSGRLDGVRRFIKTVKTSVPISEVTNIDGNGENASLMVQFYQKPYPNIQLSGDTPLVPISAEKIGLLSTLSSWKNASEAQSVLTPSGSGSAVPLF